jgi:hypothetical protein
MTTTSLVGAATYVLHVLLAGLWTGTVLTYAVGVLPLARDSSIGVEPFSSLTGWLTKLTRVSAVVLLLTGAHLAVTRVGTGALLSTRRGYLVLAMAGLWLVLAGLVEAGGSRVRANLDAGKIRTAARESGTLYRAAAVVAVLALAEAGVLAAGVV